MISNGSSIVQGQVGTSTTVLHGGITGPFYSTVNLSTDVTGVLSFVNGGTSNSAYTNGQLLIGNTLTGGLTTNTLTAGA